MATLEEFFRESNAIEDVYSDAALEDSFDAWNYLKRQDELTHEVVQEAHRLILTNLQPEIAGQYRDSQVYVGNHVPPDPAVVHLKMEELLGEVPKTGAEAVKWHVSFETIHPFPDGNGPIGRMLYLWQCRQIDVEPELWTAEERQQYYSIFDGRDGILESE